jgi:hypothetical protein
MQLLLIALLGLLFVLPAAAQETPPPQASTYVQVWLGGQGTDDDAWEAEDVESGTSVLGDLGTLPFGGGAGQRMWGSGAWQIGYEGGGLFTWKSDNTEFRGTNTALQINVDSTFATLGVFMGGVASVSPWRHMRLYVAAGPSLTWAWLWDDDDDDTTPSGDATIDLSGTENDASFVAYGRAGIEFMLDTGFTFGASVRYADDDFSFDDAGDVRFDEPLWLLTLGAQI